MSNPETSEPHPSAESGSESESEIESQTGSQPENVDDIDLSQYEDEDEDVMGAMEAMLGSILTTPEGDTVCSALVNLGHQMEIQNKILVKLVSTLQKR
tara:strand:+ start:1325 stop:1618 length:294 start_codon:yes stop_codon:yes gene_type:complete